jgi:hypothetical protein
LRLRIGKAGPSVRSVIKNYEEALPKVLTVGHRPECSSNSACLSWIVKQRSS